MTATTEEEQIKSFNERVDYLYSVGIDPYPYDSRGKRQSEVVTFKTKQLEEVKILNDF